MKIIILGSNGMLGQMTSKYFLKKNFEVINHDKYFTHENYNTYVDDINKLDSSVVINCIGKIKQKSTDPNDLLWSNSILPLTLSSKLDEKHLLIHPSTDCVFNGNKGHNNENTLPNASDIYGRSKSLGELNNSFDLTIRTSIIGPELKHNGEGLLHWLFNQSGNIYGYKNVFWSGVTTLELSKAILFSINNETSGLWNLTNGIEISKYDLIEKIINIFQLNKINLKQDNEKTSNKTLISNREIEFKVNSYDKMIVDLKSFYEDNKHFYNYTI